MGGVLGGSASAFGRVPQVSPGGESWQVFFTHKLMDRIIERNQNQIIQFYSFKYLPLVPYASAEHEEERGLGAVAP